MAQAKLRTSRSAIMIEPTAFGRLIQRVRAGDPDAAAELVRSYEPAIRRAVRVRLADARLGAVLDSMDICQSVLGSFFIRAASGQYELDTPAQLLRLLTSMARNKLVSQSRRHYAQRRNPGGGRLVESPEGHLVAGGGGPSMEVAARDLLHEVHRRLSSEERKILDLRNQGSDWSLIALEVGGSAEALRKRLSRALDRVAEQLKLDEVL
jgi:RNA polymerase sigma-70 factor (ECF subfamily)